MQVAMILFVIVLVLCIAPLFAMLGWYLFMVPVFGLKALTFLEALGLVILAASFKGINYSKN